MTNQKPIEPLPSRELVQQWADEWWDQRYESPIGELLFVTTKAAQWGFNQRGAIDEAALQKARDEELEACCEWFSKNYAISSNQLRAARRPKPKSQAEKALASLDGVALPEDAWQAVSAALERLREPEGNQ